MKNLSPDEITHIIILILLLSAFAVSAFTKSKKESLKNLKYLSIWVVIIIVGVILYSFKDSLTNNRVYSQLVPGAAISQKKSISFYAAKDGHFYVNTIINNQKIKFLLDTGATNIVLNKYDAQKIGINFRGLIFDKYFHTANGITRGASVRLDTLSVGDFHFKNIRASINAGELNTSLLGMDFLNLFSKYEFQGNKVTLYR